MQSTPGTSESVTPLPTFTPESKRAVITAPTATLLPTSDWRPVTVSSCPVTLAPDVAEHSILDLQPSPGVPRSQAGGERLVIVGTVFGPDCSPLQGAEINVWQTDPEGVYGPGHGTGELECCYLQGVVQTDANGNYQLNTLRPGHYMGEQPPPPAHLHVEISHTEADGLMTEIVFADDPYLPANPPNGYLVIALEPAAGPDGAYLYQRGVADFVLARPGAPATPAPLTGQSAGRGARTFTIQPGESQAAYHIRETFAVISFVTRAVGVTDRLDGTIEIDLADPQILRSLQVTADLRSLKSDEPNRDNKLADQWLVTSQFPQASFRAAGINNPPPGILEGQAVQFTLNGEMTIREITRPATFQVTARLGGDRLIGTAIGVIKMSDFGIDPPRLLDFVVVEDEVQLVVNFVAQEAGGISGN
jgi:protocatechuate 3,4-dioxygenase beta subunit/polyisoprenoid-binding protein YceI